MTSIYDSTKFYTSKELCFAEIRQSLKFCCISAFMTNICLISFLYDGNSIF